MRSRWEALHTGLTRSIGSRQALREFRNLQARFPGLMQFGEPIEVVARIVQETDFAARDSVLRPLAHVARERNTRPFTHALLLLCLWPGLDAILRRRLRLFRDDGQDLPTEIVHHFAVALHCLDLGRVACLTATLLRNTERRLLDDRMRELNAPARPSSVPSTEIDGATADRAAVSPFGLPDDLSTAGSVVALRDWLQRAVGQDADLVLHAVIFDRDGSEVAQALGISHAAMRKRLGRALGRARDAFLAETRSHGGGCSRLS